MASETPIELPGDVIQALLERGPSLGGHDVIFLPSETREGQTYYVEDDLDALPLARSAGLDAILLHDGANRRYLHENAAGWELSAFIAVGVNLTSAVILGLSRYISQRVHQARDQGLCSDDEGSVTIKLTVAQVRQNGATGDVTARAVKLEGNLDDVTAALDRLSGGTPG